MAVSSVKSENIQPDAPDKSVSVNKNESVDIQLSYYDKDGGPGPYSITILSQPNHGKLTGEGNDKTYVPEKDNTGTDKFSWKVNDGADDSDIATVKIVIE